MIRFLATGSVLLLATQALFASGLQVHRSVVAGQTIAIAMEGSGKGQLYIVGPGGAVERDVQLGGVASIAPDELSSAGHYSAFLVSSDSTASADFDIVPASVPATLNFLARPSRLPVSLPDGIGGVAFVFDAYRNLILQSVPVRFELSLKDASPEVRTVPSSLGVAWIQMNSSPRAGKASFAATAGDASSLRILQEVPGDPCQLHMSAHAVGDRLHVQTDPLRDCTGNPVADGTVVTFTEVDAGNRSAVDAPLKNGVAQADMPAVKGAIVSVAAGEVLGNQLHWSGGQ